MLFLVKVLIIIVLLLHFIYFVHICRDRVVKQPYGVSDTISQGSAASSNMPYANSAFYNGDNMFDPATAIAALQLGGNNAGRRAGGAFDTASLRSQDETIR